MTSKTDQKAGFVSIIGRPSAGKSTLLNKICGHKVSITSSVPQTTRNKVRGIVTKEKGQLVFVDTPGYHDSDKKFNIHLKKLAESSLKEIDLVLYVVDTTRPSGQEEENIIDLLSGYKDKLIVVLNKTDSPASKTGKIKEFIIENLNPERIFEVSALQGTGVEALLDNLLELAPEGEQMYPEDFYTDQDPEFRISEIIREKAINRVKQEVPHAMFVEIADMEESEVTTKTGDKKQRLWIRAFLNVERDSQKGILVGSKGQVIRDIRKEAQKEIGALFPYRIHLDLRVKVNYKWRRKDSILKKTLY